MDPLSIAASVAGLCTLAESIVHRTRAFVKSVRGSEKEIAKLIRATAQLYGILEQIRLLEDGIDEEFASGGLHMVRGEELHECEKTLRRLDGLLRKSDPASAVGFVSVARKKLEWPFNSKEVAELLQDIENHKSMLNLALNANEMAAILSCLETATNVSKIVSQEQLENEEFRTSQRKSVFSRRRQRILDFMTTVDPRTDQAMYIQMKQDMTGLWFTEGEEFKTWTNTRNSTLWLSGIPGAGKTILFSSIIDKLQKTSDEKSVMAFFYCDYRNMTKQDASIIIRSLIRQFSERNDSCFEKLEEFYEIHSSEDKTSLPTQSDLVELLLDMSDDVEDALILIDALDECLKERVAVIKLLRDLSIRSEKIKTLFASRDEVDISTQLQGYTTVSMAENNSDIARYVESELKVKDWAKDLNATEKDAIKDSLIEPAGGMFRLVACQLDALSKCKTIASRRKVLKTLPRDLSEVYYRILKQIDSTEVADNRVIVQRVLRWVTWGKAGLSLKELQEAIAINPGDEILDRDAITAESDILDLCSSLVRLNPDGILELAHATVKEFLTTIPPSSEYHFYRVDESSDMADLAITCLTYLCLENFEEENDWDDSSSCSTSLSRSLVTESVVSNDESKAGPKLMLLNDSEKLEESLQHHFLRHATRYWDQYAEGVSSDRSDVVTLERTLFAPSKIPQFLNWARHRLQSTPTLSLRWKDELLIAESTPLQWAALLGLFDTCQWLIDQGSDINRSTVVIGSTLACAVLGESLLQRRNRGGSSYTLDDEREEEEIDHDPKANDSWHRETRSRTISALLNAQATFDGLPTYETKSLMQLALTIGEPEHVKLLLTHGGMLDTECLKYLEKECADGHRKVEMQEILKAVTKSNCSPNDLPRATKLLLQFETSSSQAAKFLVDTLDASKDERSEAQDRNETLRKVSEYGQYDLVAQLLEHPDIIVDSPGSSGYTALHEAAQSGHLRVVELLVEKGFNVNLIENDGETPAFRAAVYNHLEVVRFLQKHGAVLAEQANTAGESIAHAAAEHDCLRVIRYIAETEPQLVRSTTVTPEGLTVLMYAAEKGSAKTVQYILDKFSADEITAKSNVGRSALHYAAASDNKKVVEVLLKKHPNVNIQSGNGYTALHFAAESSRNPTIVNALINAGVDCNIKDNSGDVAAHFVASRGEWDHFSILKRLIDAAGDECSWINDMNSKNSMSLLQVIAGHDLFTDYSFKMLNLLCDIPKLDFELLGHHKQTPFLELVAKLSRNPYSKKQKESEKVSANIILPPHLPSDMLALFEAVQALVRRGAAVNHADSGGNTALHLLCSSILNFQVCNAMEFLLQNSASINVINKAGSNVIDALFSRLNKGPVSPDIQRNTQRMLTLLIDHATDDELKHYHLENMQLLNLCIQVGNPTIIRKLLGRGVGVDTPDITPTGAIGYTPTRAICVYKTADGIANEILEKSSDLNCLDAEGCTLLVIACRYGRVEIARALIAKGVDPLTTALGVRALADAAYNGHTQVVELLLGLGVDIDSTFGDRRMTPLMHAIERGNLATIKLLLERKADVSIKAVNQWTLAHYLASREDLGFVYELQDHGLTWDEPATIRGVRGARGGDVTGVTPLHIAAEKGFTSMIVFLWDNKLIENLSVKNSVGTTALHVATRVGNIRTVRTLLQYGADVNQKDELGFTPVHLAASSPVLSRFQLLILEELLATGKYRHYLRTNESQSALHLAARLGAKNIVTQLLATPEDVNARDKNWLTPLHYATVRGDMDIVNMLAEAGAKHNAPSSSASSVNGDEKQHIEPPPVYGANSLLLAAIKQRDVSLCKRAAKEGADLEFRFPECKEGICSPLLFAIDGHKTGYGLFSPSVAVAEFLADQDVDVNAKGCTAGLLPIHLAASRGFDGCIKKLLSKGAKTRDRSLEALHFAVLGRRKSTVELLLSHEASLEGGSKKRLINSPISSIDAMAFKSFPSFTDCTTLAEPYSGTAMHIAAYVGDPDILELLLKEGADVDSLNESNHTPLMHAMWTDEHRAIQVLLDAGASITQRDDFGRTPAYFALGSNDTFALEALQKKGADFYEGEFPNSWLTETYLNQALYLEAWENVEFLLKLGHDPNRHTGPFPRTPLQVALQTQDAVRMEEFVAEHAPEYDDNVERYGTLLVAACSQSSPSLVRKLIEKAQANNRDIPEYVNSGCYVHGTPLYAAAYRGNLELIQLLLDAGADVKSREEGYLGTPLDAACAMERVEAVRLLFENGACIKKTKMEGLEIAEGCRGSKKMEVIREILRCRDPFLPGSGGKNESGSGSGSGSGGAGGGRLVSRQTF